MVNNLGPVWQALVPAKTDPVPVSLVEQFFSFFASAYMGRKTFGKTASPAVKTVLENQMSLIPFPPFISLSYLFALCYPFP